MNQSPLVSICIPTYNGASYLEETIECAINQTYKNIEIVITDDNSSDETVAICTSYAQKDNRIKFFQNKTNLGLKKNWCEVIDKTSEQSEWIKFLFQDDLMDLSTVEKMVSASISENVNFVFCDREYFFDNDVDRNTRIAYSKVPKTGKIFNTSKKYSPKEASNLITKFFFQNCLGEPPCIMFSKAKYKHSDFPSEFIQLIDYVFVLEKILSDNFYFINEKLIKFRVHNTSQSNKNTTNNNLKDKKKFNKFIHVHYYEQLKLSYLLLSSKKYVNILNAIGKSEVEKINDFLIIKMYYKNITRIRDLSEYLKTTELKNWIIYRKSMISIFINYKIQKKKKYLLRKKYRV